MNRKVLSPVVALALASGLSVATGTATAFACPAAHVRDYTEFVDSSSCPNVVITKVNSVPLASTWYEGQYWNHTTWVNGSLGRKTIADGAHRVTMLTGIIIGTHIRFAAGTAAGIDFEY